MTLEDEMMKEDVETSATPEKPETEKKNHTWIIIVVVILILLVCCCGGSLWLAWNYGDEVLEALSQVYGYIHLLI
jgi:flagellar basal body-associated protein FliL